MFDLFNKMKSNSNTTKKQKLKLPKEKVKEKNKINKKYLSPQKIHKDIKIDNPNFKNAKKPILKSPKTNKKQTIENIKTEKINSNNLKEQYSLCEKELKAVRDEEEKIKALRNKLKLQNGNYNNNISKNPTKEKITNTTTKIKRKKIQKDFSPSPEKYKKNLLNMIEKTSKTNKKKLTSYSNQNIHKTRPVIKNTSKKPNKLKKMIKMKKRTIKI